VLAMLASVVLTLSELVDVPRPLSTVALAVWLTSVGTVWVLASVRARREQRPWWLVLWAGPHTALRWAWHFLP
jgi:hypothetical protein